MPVSAYYHAVIIVQIAAAVYGGCALRVNDITA
jgi:hypothetical protein